MFDAIKLKDSFISNFSSDSPLEINGINWSLFFLYVNFLFFFNCLLMNDSVIKSYNTHTISQEKIILSALIAMFVSLIILKLLKTLINFSPKLRMMIKDIKKEDELFEKVKG